MKCMYGCYRWIGWVLCVVYVCVLLLLLYGMLHKNFFWLAGFAWFTSLFVWIEDERRRERERDDEEEKKKGSGGRIGWMDNDDDALNIRLRYAFAHCSSSI